MTRPTFTEVIDVLEATKTGSQWMARCPCHDDQNPSLAIDEKQGRPVVHCHAGCDQREVWLRVCEIVAEHNGHDLGAAAAESGTIEATYDYVDEGGTLLFQVVRKAGKRFYQRRPAGDAWVTSLAGVRRVLYRLPELIKAVAHGEPVYVVEGEKDVDRARGEGITATCNPMGAGKWDDTYAESLRGADVTIVRDDDDPGHKHARDVVRSLTGVARSVRVVEALSGKDLSDHLDAGHSLDELREVQVQPSRSGAINGAAFILDIPAEVPSIWGRSQEALWARGESLLLVGPQGVGKSTLVQQLALARIGLGSTLLDLPVEQDDRPVLYIAADRPLQIQRSIRRMVTEDDRSVLSERLSFWRGPLPFNLTSEPERFARFIEEFGVGTVFVDSLKDIALDLSKDEAGSRVNAAFQAALACGVEVVALHHQRKAQATNKKPTSLADVYGSTWITAGAGSVLLLWGAPGDAVIEVSHLKQPAQEFGPVMVVHDHATGRTEIQPEFDIRVVLKSSKGITVKQAAQRLFSTDDPSRNQVEKARRKLEGLVADGRATKQERERESGGRPEALYHLQDDLT